MLVFDVAQFDGILKKITEFNNALLSDPVGLHMLKIFSFYISLFPLIFQEIMCIFVLFFFFDKYVCFCACVYNLLSNVHAGQPAAWFFHLYKSY